MGEIRRNIDGESVGGKTQENHKESMQEGFLDFFWCSVSEQSSVRQQVGSEAEDSAGELLGESAGRLVGLLGMRLSMRVGLKLGTIEGTSPGS